MTEELLSGGDHVMSPSRFDAEVTIRRTRYTSDATGWAVLDAACEDGDSVVLVGPLVHLEEREHAHVIGSWVNDSRYGRQVKVAQATPLPPSDPATLITYLRRVRHVGERRARALIARHGPEGVLEAIDRDPEEELARVGLRPRRAREAAMSWQALRVLRRLHLLLAPHGLGYLVNRIHEQYGADAHRILTSRPYELTSVFGVGFAIADRLARGAGGPGAPDDPDRIRAGVLHLLAEAERRGSTCMALEGLLGALGQLLGSVVSAAAIDELERTGDLVALGEWIYRAQTAELEAELAQRVTDLVRDSPNPRLHKPNADGVAHPSASSDPQVDRGPAPGPGPGAVGELTAEQLAGVRNAFTNRLSLITGGPGTGKTASIRAIGSLAAARGARIMLAAPTGRAATRMTQASGIRARTVHSALGWVPGEGPTHDEQDPLACDLLIIDETSMANLELLVTLLRAVGPRTHVVLVGDADQLAPVGAGKPFAELVSTTAVASTWLTHIFRQAAGSMIVQGAHAIRRGETPEFTPSAQTRRDLFLIERPDPDAALQEIVSLVSRRLPAHYDIDPVRDIQVFAPVYRGELGIDRLNGALRDALNPDGRPVRSGRLRLGDKLMMTGRNLHDQGLMNGTLLRLLDEIAPADDDQDEAALILSAEESIFRLAPDDSERLALAYACSVHRGQGIELPIAVIVAHPACGAFFLRREMLYTAITRATLATVIVGTRQVIARAARTPDTGGRHTRLAQRLQSA
ncbi:MAG: SF1B family DNA helicase RecD2 [Solirubrobacteraceae bacterium]